MTPAAATVLLVAAKMLMGFGLLWLLWIWSTDPINRDRRFANALLVGGVVVVAFVVRFLP